MNWCQDCGEEFPNDSGATVIACRKCNEMRHKSGMPCLWNGYRTFDELWQREMNRNPVLADITD